MEGLAETYFERLITITNSPLVLASFFCDLYSKSVDSKTISTMAKLTRMYGKYNVYYAILDFYDVDNATLDNIYPLLVYFCKKQVNKNRTIVEYLDTKSIGKVLEKLSKKPIKLGNPWND